MVLLMILLSIVLFTTVVLLPCLFLLFTVPAPVPAPVPFHTNQPQIFAESSYGPFIFVPQPAPFVNRTPGNSQGGRYVPDGRNKSWTITRP
jgi:hypothetical protein